MTGCLHRRPVPLGGKFQMPLFGRKTQSQLEPQHGETFGKCPLRGVKSKDILLLPHHVFGFCADAFSVESTTFFISKFTAFFCNETVRIKTNEVVVGMVFFSPFSPPPPLPPATAPAK